MAKQHKTAVVESTKHQDTRVNIPTEELRDFVAEDEAAPKTMLYPRDPSLDPQLVWQGKDAQDAKDLAVPVVPIYIQEKIHPQALIDDLLAQAARKGDGLAEEAAAYQLNLFADFNGLPEEFDQRVDFYRHDGHWSNRMILGDSLLVMTSLAEKEGLKGQVQTIYIDPPYGIKFGSNWQVSTRKRDVKDSKAEDATRQPEQVRAFRDTWKLGIHSYLAYLRDRLTVARELLTETGSVFVQIGDENVHLVRCVLDEVFGAENFVAVITFRKKTMPLGAVFLEGMCDYLIWYAKQKPAAKYRQLYREQDVTGDFHWNWYELEGGTRVRITNAEVGAGKPVPAGARVARLVSMWPPTYSAHAVFGVQSGGREWFPPSGQCWPTNPQGTQRLERANRLQPEGQYLRYVLRQDDYNLTKLTTTWQDTIGARDQTYVVETATTVIERCLLMTTDPGDLVLDPTCGSGTTAYVAEQWGRRWITCDTSRVALALARTRLMAAKYPYYLLADSPAGIHKEAELSKLPPSHATGGDIRQGFVYKRVPHVTLKSIANNEEIDAIHARYQERLEPLRAQMNRLLKQSWEEWQIPRDLPSPSGRGAGGEVQRLHAEWWRLRRERQAEIDASIARRAETETLYDQPYEDKKTVRVSGPLTVESLSPHRVLATADDDMDGVVTRREAQRGQDFAALILDNLRKAGVQNTKKGERLTFDRLEPYAGSWLHAAGEYTDAEGKTRRVAVSIGPEQGTVGPQQVKEAAKEAVQGVGYDLLLVCGFAFDPHVSEEAKRYGKLMVLPVKMNPDLAMGDDLLKKTGAGNLFMVFGEPDVEIKKQPDGRISVEIKGVDVYDPTTGEIRSSSTDDIACWFIDTDYDGESFFVRQAYFTGADEPYDKLKRALRAEIDEAAWASLYSTASRPFARPATGKIAVKVINHYGDEVLKVFAV